MLDLEGQTVTGFREKAKEDGGWINGGFMVMEQGVFDYLNTEEGCVLERQPMEALAREGKLGIYKHSGFWQCMDTQRAPRKYDPPATTNAKMVEMMAPCFTAGPLLIA